ncbi:hypothetical protein NQ317_017114 [Molorchus minor]|uniref:Uncharacterized protein n=1 Tax=Molorchus minor TaxID=1323400 RepID=A0ABQ9JH37_9CUCU|nr:hypothetical protein NQ317_017114 [Molorchus minor]
MDRVSFSNEKKPRSVGSVYSASTNSSNEDDFDDSDGSTNTMGLRSPSGPMRGRSVKEFEEQLASLKRKILT